MCWVLSCPPLTQLEKLVPYIPANVYGGESVFENLMLRRKEASLVMMFIDSTLQMLATSLLD